MKAKPAILLLYVFIPLYPFVVHFGLVKSSYVPLLLLAAVCLFLYVIRFYKTLMLQLAVIVATLILMESGKVDSLYFLPPMAINFVIGIIFLNGLGKNKTTVIEKYIVVLEGRITEAERQYARRLTVAWAAILFLLMAESGLLALFASYETWSLFTNFINYLILAMMFIIEYQVRIRVFTEKQHMGFFEYLNRLRKVRLTAVVM